MAESKEVYQVSHKIKALAFALTAAAQGDGSYDARLPCRPPRPGMKWRHGESPKDRQSHLPDSDQRRGTGEVGSSFVFVGTPPAPPPRGAATKLKTTAKESKRNPK